MDDVKKQQKNIIKKIPLFNNNMEHILIRDTNKKLKYSHEEIKNKIILGEYNRMNKN